MNRALVGLFVCSDVFLVSEARNDRAVGLGVLLDAGGYFDSALLRLAQRANSLLNQAVTRTEAAMTATLKPWFCARTSQRLWTLLLTACCCRHYLMKCSGRVVCL